MQLSTAKIQSTIISHLATFEIGVAIWPLQKLRTKLAQEKLPSHTVSDKTRNSTV